MIVESLSIILIILGIFVVFLRSKRADYALSTIPLAIVPAAQLLSELFVPSISRGLSLDAAIVQVGVVAGSLIIACIVMGLMSNQIRSKRSRGTYLAVCGMFLLILSSVFIHSTLSA